MFIISKKIPFIFIIISMVFPKTNYIDYKQVESNVTEQNIIQNDFESKYGNDWQFEWNINNTPHRVFGHSISHSFNALDEDQSEISARSFIEENPSFFNISNENLSLWVNEQHGKIRYLIFNQYYNNIPVWNGRIDFRYRLNGDLVMLGHDAFPKLNLDTTPVIGLDDAKLIAKLDIGFDETLEDEVTKEPELFIWVENKNEPKYHLAWLTELFVHSTELTDEVPVHRWKVFVDAKSGLILEKIDQVRQLTLEGHVYGSVKDEPFGEATMRGMQHVKVAVSGVGNAYTDENGYYSIDIGNSDRSVNVKLEGNYLNTNNQNGSDASITRTVSPGTTEDFDFTFSNSIPGERDTYYHANLIHDHAKSLDNGMTGGDYIMPAAVNIGSEDSYWPCNAYWDYTGINLFSEGGGCAATDQMADVIYHEYGHGLQQFIYDPYSPSYSGTGLSEGCSDYWAMSLVNSPCLGNGFFGEGTCLRDGENTLQYPANSCGGSVHCMGEYIMGSLWKMRENLIALHGYDAGVQIADELFYWGQTGRPFNDPDYLTEILIADDNDGSIANGTPNYMQICDAFGTHNLDCPFDGPFAELEITSQSLDFVVSQGEIATSEIQISNVGQENSVLTYNSGATPFVNNGGGPDEYATFWSDSDIEESLSYEWIDISNDASLYNFQSNDDAGEPIEIGFEFPFMGSTYSQLFVNPNGWLGFGSDNSGWENLSIPSSAAPGPAIFGLWDDLNPINDDCNSYCSGEVYYNSNSQRLVVWFDEVAHWWTNFENSFYNFQFVLYVNGDIQINYQSLTGDHSATVGIQNADGSNGLEVAFDENYLHDNLSINFSKGPDWITLSPSSGQVNQGSTESIQVEVNSAELMDGDYSGFISFVTSGGNAGIPISMTVSGSILSGDVNGDDIVNILDIISLVNFILDISFPETWQFIAGDTNGDGILNILDVIQIVNSVLED